MNTQDTQVQENINAIFDAVILARKGHYVHALEIENVQELESCIDALYDEFSGDYSEQQVFEFISTLQIYCTDENYEDEVNEFNISRYLNDLMYGDNWSNEMHGY